MTIDQMIEYLQEYKEELGPDTEVRMMVQQTWPMDFKIQNLISSDQIHGRRIQEEAEFEEVLMESEPPTDKVLYIVEGDRVGYGTKAAWIGPGW
jgi:hypothetical protein